MLEDRPSISHQKLLFSVPDPCRTETQIVIAGSLKLTAYSPENGEARWWYDGLSRIVDSTPVVAGGKIFLATWTPGGDNEERISMEPFADALTSYDKDGDKEIAQTELPADGEIIQRFFVLI